MQPNLIWALLDERQGNTSQTLGVAEALGWGFVVKQVRFNPLIRIPNALISGTNIGIDRESLKTLTPPWPDMVISTARRLGLVSTYIKAQNPACFIAQIQWPGAPVGAYDFIATPMHDGIAASERIFLTPGAPHRVTPQKLAQEAQQWSEPMQHYPAPRIALLVGGSTRSRAFSEAHARELGALSSHLAVSLGGSLLVTTSRRTGENVGAALAASLTAPHHFHGWDDVKSPENNPFYGFLGLSDVVVTTGDSISMCSEACATGKPVFVYARDVFMSPKHSKFLQDLYAKRLARPLEHQNQLFTPPYRLDDASTIAGEIKQRFKG